MIFYSDDSRARARRLKLMAFDVDGVLSDGALFFTDEGLEIKAFNSQDGLGMRLLQQAGIQLAVITGRTAGCVDARMRNLGIDLFYHGIEDKEATLRELLSRVGLSADEVGYMGDDIVDLRIMAACGFSAAPANAHPLAKRQANLVTAQTGGYGAAREVCEFILDAQGKLHAAFSPYLPDGAR